MVNLAANLSMMFNEVNFMDRFKEASNQKFKSVEYLFPYDFSKDDILNELKENTFYAQIHVSNNGTNFVIDSRPSDAIALAIRVGSPVFVNEKVLDEAKSVDFEKPVKLDENQEFPTDVKDFESPESSGSAIEEDKDQIKDWLKNLKPGDFLKEDS